MKNMNLKPKRNDKWAFLHSKHFITVYIALALVLIVNQIIFTVVLKDRERAKAFSSTLGPILMSNLGNQSVHPGANNVLLAQFLSLDVLGNSTVTCSYALTGNPCVAMVDADGTATAGAGIDDDGAGYLFQLEPNGRTQRIVFTHNDGVCTDSLTTPTCVYIDSDLDCDATTGTQTYVLGAACGGPHDLSVVPGGLSFPIWAHSELVNANGQYDYGNGSAATETIWQLNYQVDNPLEVGSDWTNPHSGQWQGDPSGTWTGALSPNAETYVDVGALGHFVSSDPVIIDVNGDGLYDLGTDIDVYGLGGALVGGETLLGMDTAHGPDGQPLIFAKSDNHAGGLDATGKDTILEDEGDIQTGPAGMPNGVIDRLGDQFDHATFKNIGTAPASSISNVKFWVDPGLTGFNGVCDNPPGSVDDINVGGLTYDPVNSQWVTNFSLNLVIPLFFRVCVTADISPTAQLGSTIVVSMPQLLDANANGLYDVGDSGTFYYSTNDGPTGGSIDAPYAITIVPFPSGAVAGGAGTGQQDTIPPASPTNVNITASSTGNVAITWIDPSDADLSQVVIDEEYLGNSVSDSENKGVQALNLTGRIVGGTYQYSIRALDSSGNYSPQLIYSITIPASGEVTVNQPLYLPTPAPTVPTIPSNLILHDPEPAPPLPANVQIGTLVKSVDIPSVYFIDQDNRRHAFPNEVTYFSWFSDFSGVKTISADTLAAIPLGSNVTIRPGTYLLKIQTDPKVYAVEPYGVIRWVSSEVIANKLYGSDWSKRIVDVADSFFFDYQVGATIDTAVHPTGSVISYSGEATTYYIENGAKRYLTSAVFNGDKFQNKFAIRNVGTDLIYIAGENYALLPMETLMQLK